MLAVGDAKPYKVRIELVADEWQGDRRWVAPSRLEVLWDDRHDYIALDEKIRALKVWQPSRRDRRTAEHVFFKLIPLDVAEFNADSAGTSVIHDAPALALLSGLSQDELRADPAFLHDQELSVPWPTTERVGRAVAAMHPYLLLSEIEREEREANERALNGVTITDFDGEDHQLSPADALERFEKRQKPYLDKLREWIGVERTADLLERRDLLSRLGVAVGVADRALNALEPTQKRIAQKLRGALAGLTDGLDALPPSQRNS
ncbi:hypothetical protein [Curtobacterium flaccumfaciens]|uniref:hypothetical protein n=1 Tax=Curtobacterium flaccumfaciens TaxID=2035 RepID=UPI001BE0F014|nr:hypothetical protein [Curtobacterium flaccumfaciens]MBT1582581.1 hypothetical protein [Curtobacterium flaccumfaciens pv. flaccumfaciens]MCX2796823.1 hypothetical protein [Curtobacterium flaccumfaciens pv. flaccumfaciens]